MDRTALDLWVGIFVVAGLAALSVLALKVGNLSSYNMSETYQLQAYFSNIGGLKSQASIKSSGVLIGRVAMISLDPERYEAKVTMNIDLSLIHI
jgi:phospholipid/cholesterol/gamma-HCH transport system substrate-binding protein